MNRNTDPEILADQRARERVAGGLERPLEREPAHAMGSPAIVEHWPCRRCKTPVGITASALEAARTMNRYAASRGIEPIRKSEAVACPACGQIEKAETAARDRANSEERVLLTRDLYASVENDPRIAGILRRLGELGEPDVRGLARDAEAKRAARKPAATRSRL